MFDTHQSNRINRHFIVNNEVVIPNYGAILNERQYYAAAPPPPRLRNDTRNAIVASNNSNRQRLHNTRSKSLNIITR